MILSRNHKTKLTTFVLFNPNLLKRTFDATTFANVDAEVTAVEHPPSDAEIVADLLETEDFSDDDDDYSSEDGDEPIKCPDKNELFQIIKTLQRFSLFLDKEDTIQLTLVTLKVKSISTLLRRSKHPLGTF